jgi:hypothetical protein
MCQGVVFGVPVSQSVKTPEKSDLLQTTVSVDAMNVPIYDVVQSLRNDYHVPISFIDADADSVETQHISFVMNGVPVRNVLDKITSTLSTYKFQTVEGRIILFPDTKKYQLTMSGVEIRNTRRIDAVSRYISQLMRQYPVFGNLLTPPMKGDTASPVYQDEVSLRPNGTVLEHFIQLLGNDPKVVFSIVKTKAGAPMFLLDMVR